MLLLAACGPAAQATSTPGPTAVPTRAPAAATSPAPTATAVAARATPTTNPTAEARTPPAASSGEPRYGGTLRVGDWLEPAGWDPFEQASYRTQIPVSLAHERLFVWKTQPGCTLESEPSLAQSWKWVNDTTLEVQLRPGVRFADRPPVNGREITADDVAYSFTVQGPKNNILGPFLGLHLNKVEVVNKGTVRFMLLQPNAFFIDRGLNRFAYVVPKEAFDAKGKITEAAMNIGAGPFLLDEYKPGVSVTYSKNSKYWRPGLPYVDKVDIKIIRDVATQMAMLRSKKLDYTYWQAQHPFILEARKTLQDYDVQVCPKPNPPIIGMRHDQKPFDDVRVRRAVSMAVDREGVLKSVYLGLGQQVSSTVSGAYGQMFLAPDKLPPDAQQYLQYNPQAARKLLAEAGYPNGFKTRVWATPTFGNVFMGMAESLVASLNAIGIDAQIYVPEYTIFYEKKNAGTFDGLIVAWSSGQSVHEAVWDNYYYSGYGGPQYHYVRSPLDEMIEKLNVAYDVKEQLRIVQQIQTYAATNIPMLAMPATLDAGVSGKWVKGLYLLPTWDMWVDHLRGAWLDK